MKTDPNDTAYPAPHSIDGNWQKEPLRPYLGLTKRELFSLEFAKLIPRGNGGEFSRTARMQAAVADADALIATLNEEAK